MSKSFKKIFETEAHNRAKYEPQRAEPSWVHIGARQPPDVHFELKKLAVLQGTSIENLIALGLNVILEGYGSDVRAAYRANNRGRPPKPAP